MIDNLDRNIGDLIATLKEKNFYENTFILFTSDNGGPNIITWQSPLRAGKGCYYEGWIREPFFVVWPGRIEPGTCSDLPVYNLDIYPTLLDAAGLDKPAGYQLDGLSFLSTLTGNPQKEFRKRPMFWHFPTILSTIVLRDLQV